MWLKRFFIRVFYLVLLVLLFFMISYWLYPYKTERVAYDLLSPVIDYVIELRSDLKKEKYSDYQPSAGEIWGIDISHHQRGIRWSQFDNMRPHFVFLKATQGASHIDSRYERYISEIDELDIPVGSYHFFEYDDDGEDQARHFLEIAKIRKGDLPPVLDVEEYKRMASSKWIAKNVNRFLEYVEEKTGVRPILYCTCNYYNRYLEGKLDKNYILWIADYSGQPNCKFTFWQRSDSFKHDAFRGRVDLNYFSGDKLELESLRID